MIDRDKVMKGLEHCSRTASGKKVECSECPYNSGDFQCVRHLFADALALLKAQQEKIELLQKNSRFSSIVVCRDCAYAYDTSTIGDRTLYRCVHDGFYRGWNGCCDGGVPSWLNEPNGWERLTGEGEKEQNSDSPEGDDG